MVGRIRSCILEPDVLLEGIVPLRLRPEELNRALILANGPASRSLVRLVRLIEADPIAIDGLLPILSHRDVSYSHFCPRV